MSEFTPTHRIAVSYIDKSRQFYFNKGFNNPYRWASHSDAPFAKLQKPLADSTIAVVTTAAPNEEAGNNRKLWSAPSHAIPEETFTHHLSWHKTATHTDDLGSFLPLAHLQDAAERGRIGALGANFYGVPTTFSQRQTNTEDGPAVLKQVRQDHVDAVILIPL